MTLTIPNAFTQLTKAKASEVNANFDAIEAWANDSTLDIPAGSLALAKVVSGSPAQIIVCNSSGVPTYRTPAGSLNVDSSGNTSLDYFSAYADDIGQNFDGSTYVDVAGGTPGAGTWLLSGRAECRIGDDAIVMLYDADLRVNGVAVDSSRGHSIAGSLGENNSVGVALMARSPAVLDADDTVTVAGVAFAGGVAGTCVASARIQGIRVG